MTCSQERTNNQWKLTKFFNDQKRIVFEKQAFQIKFSFHGIMRSPDWLYQSTVLIFRSSACFISFFAQVQFFYVFGVNSYVYLSCQMLKKLIYFSFVFFFCVMCGMRLFQIFFSVFFWDDEHFCLESTFSPIKSAYCLTLTYLLCAIFWECFY